MSLLILYWGIMIACYLIAARLRAYADRFGFINVVLNAVIYIMVLLMGLRMGANEEVVSSLGTIGVQSVLITLFAVCGSMLAVTVLRKALHINRKGMAAGEVTQEMPEAYEMPEVPEASGRPERSGGSRSDGSRSDKAQPDKARPDSAGSEKNNSAAKTTVLILICVAAGMLLGYFAIPRLFDDVSAFQEMSDSWLVVGICVLLALVGFTLGLDGSVVKSLKTAGIRVFLFPLAAIAGSLIFGALYGLISPLTVRETAAISMGFGWYTFAPGVIAEAGHAVAGAVSFLHNVIRETLGIIIIPLAAQKIGYLEATTIPGVAAMDICMPIVERSCGSETVVYSFCMGAIMSLAVALLVPLLIG